MEKIIKRERNGKVSLWVMMPNGEEWNIWDLDKKAYTKDVKSAIESAFELGVRYASESLKDTLEELKGGQK